MSEHTELPWNVSDIDKFGGYDCITDAIHVGPIEIDAADYGQLCSGDEDYDKDKMFADARLISVSVNNHERLVEALAEMVELYESEVHDSWDGTSQLGAMLGKADKARTLLASLEAEEGGEL